MTLLLRLYHVKDATKRWNQLLVSYIALYGLNEGSMSAFTYKNGMVVMRDVHNVVVLAENQCTIKK